jgi:hypothetical protein
LFSDLKNFMQPKSFSSLSLVILVLVSMIAEGMGTLNNIAGIVARRAAQRRRQQLSEAQRNNDDSESEYDGPFASSSGYRADPDTVTAEIRMKQSLPPPVETKTRLFGFSTDVSTQRTEAAKALTYGILNEKLENVVVYGVPDFTFPRETIKTLNTRDFDLTMKERKHPITLFFLTNKNLRDDEVATMLQKSKKYLLKKNGIIKMCFLRYAEKNSRVMVGNEGQCFADNLEPKPIDENDDTIGLRGKSFTLSNTPDKQFSLEDRKADIKLLNLATARFSSREKFATGSPDELQRHHDQVREDLSNAIARLENSRARPKSQ